MLGKLFIPAICFWLLCGCLHCKSAASSAHEGGTTISWDTTTLTRVATGGYARMIELQNGKLVTVYAASSGNTEVVFSTDKGVSWSVPVVVAARRNTIRMDAPDIVLLNDGSLLVSYNLRPSSRNTDTASRFGIGVIKSYDNGLTWVEDKLLYKAGHEFKNGCWEPAAIHLPNGQIQLFFSDEGVYTHSDEQNISMFVSNDNGNNWTASPQVVSFRAGSRDGMPAPLYLPGEKRVVFSIEDNGYSNFKPYIIRSAKDGRWNEVVNSTSSDRTYALRDSLDKKVYAGAPYLRRLSNGLTLLSYQSTQYRGEPHQVNNAEMVVCVGDEKAGNFNSATIPFKIPAGNSGLWNSITVLKDDTIIALTSTSAYGSRGEVWMIKGRLTRN